MTFHPASPLVTAQAPARPLEQEPLLAARIMIEDVMNLLLDVDDIDRLSTHMAAMAQAQQRAAAAAALDRGLAPAAAAGAAAAVAAAAAAGVAPPVTPYGPTSAAPPAAPQLRQRRELLLAGINGAFRLPNTPAGAGSSSDAAAAVDAAAGADGVALGDGVLLRIMALSKGRTVVARALLASAPPASLKPPAAPGAKAPGSKAAAGKGAAAAPEAPKPAEERDQKEAADAAAADAANGKEGAEGAAAADDAAAASSASALGPNGPSPYVLLWAVLRNAWQLFGPSLQGLDPAAERPMLEATSRLAAALRDALLRLPTPRDVVDAAVAFNAGAAHHVEALGRSNPGAGPMETTMLPLAQTRAVEVPAGGAAGGPGGVAGTPSAWLGEALAALVTRASQLGLAAAAGASEGAGAAGEPAAAAVLVAGGEGADVDAAWVREYGQLHERVARHLGTLGGIHAMATSSNNAEALAVVRALCCRCGVRCAGCRVRGQRTVGCGARRMCAARGVSGSLAVPSSFNQSLPACSRCPPTPRTGCS